MKRSLVFLAVATLAGAAFADFGDVLASWKTPKAGSSYGTCLGLAWDGEYIWCNVSLNLVEDQIYRCSPSDGSVISSFGSGFHNYLEGRGMCHRQWNGAPCLEVAVWEEREDKAFLYRYRYNGSIVDRTLLSVPGTATSVVFDGTNDWVVEPMPGSSQVYRLAGNGSPISSFTLNQRGAAFGITRQADFFWFAVGIFDAGGYKTRLNGSVVASFGIIGLPDDCTYENKHLWLCVSSTVYCYDVSNAPAVTPASLGRVKALFR